MRKTARQADRELQRPAQRLHDACRDEQLGGEGEPCEQRSDSEDPQPPQEYPATAEPVGHPACGQQHRCDTDVVGGDDP
ncbi:MAG: hypothetical protein OXH86_12955 [Acidimicrobiaceae bacterium]|nr:hypothetical protein [Acidimicrobiaceae bacterium]